MIARYLTHPQVVIDPDVPVSRWGLSHLGQARVETLIQSDLLVGTTRIVTSAEQKALDTARPIGDALGMRVVVIENTHENDRTSTGYLPAEEFVRTADAFFADPDASIRGWETARYAQDRIVREVEAILEQHTNGDLLIVGHGAVGTLLYCHLVGQKISRKLDQFGGGGCLFTFDIATRKPLCHWQTIEDTTT